MSCRILGVLLQKPRTWTLSEITEELAKETRRTECAGVSFGVSFSLASRVLRSLEEELLVRHRPTPLDPDQAVSARTLAEEPLVVRRNPILVPEPKRLLTMWAQEYLEDVRSILLKNPGFDLDYVHRWLREFDRSLGEKSRERFDEARQLPPQP